ncbi:MAG: hypothetical protein WAW75_05025 [Gallionella sp.]
MAQNDFRSLPANAAGLTPASSASAWAYGAWVQASASLASDIYVQGLVFEVTNVVGLDTTVQQLFEIGTGAGGAEATKIQLPWSIRQDTLVGYYKTNSYAIYLPEPMLIAQGTRVAVRCTDSLASAITYNGVKIRYMEGATTANAASYLMLMGVG